MTFRHNFPTSAGPRGDAPGRALAISALPGAVLAVAARLDRSADSLLAEGRREQAERLSWRAAALREAVR